MATNQQYNSSVFSLLFGEKEKLIELYNAIEGTSYGPDTKIEINTLERVLYMGRYNDISFTIEGRYVVLFEHQSSVNENMPLRALIYIGRIYEKIIDSQAIYKEKLIKIPAPEFYVLYNGVKEYPADSILKLSDAFLELSTALELQVRVININYKEMSTVLAKSETLREYSYFINCAREYRSSGISLEESVELAVRRCVKEGVLREFLENHASEVVNMLFAEFDMDVALQVREREGMERGVELGHKQGIELGHKQGVEQGEKRAKLLIAENLLGFMDVKAVAKNTGLTIREVEGLRKPLS